MYGLVLSTVSDPQEMIPFNPVRERVGAESVPRIEAPLVTVWGSEGTRVLRARMLFTTAAAAEAILNQWLMTIDERVVGFVVVIGAVFCLTKSVCFKDSNLKRLMRCCRR